MEFRASLPPIKRHTSDGDSADCCRSGVGEYVLEKQGTRETRGTFAAIRGRSVAVVFGVLSIGYLSLAAGLRLAQAHPSQGYELDLYASTPVHIWILLLSGMMVGIVVVFCSTIGHLPRRFLAVGCGLAVLGRLSLSAVPFARGYTVFGGDAMSHVGMVQDIVATGHIGDGNFYPVTHVLLAAVSDTAACTVVVAMGLCGLMMSALFVVGTLLLSRTVAVNRLQPFLALLLALGAFFSLVVTPNQWSILLMPCVLYVTASAHSVQKRILLLVLAVLFPFFHPLSAVVLGAVLFVTLTVGSLLSRLVGQRRDSDMLPDGAAIWRTLAVLVVVLAPWLLSFRWFYGNLRLLWTQIVTLSGGEALADVGETLNKLQLDLGATFELFIRLYGLASVIGLFAVVELFWLVWRLRAGPVDRATLLRSVLGVGFLVIAAGFVGNYVGLPGVGAFGGDRLLRYATVLGIPLAATGMWHALNGIRARRLAQVCAVCLVIAVVYVGARSAYHSPFVYRPNGQTTSMDIVGMKWMLTKTPALTPMGFIVSPPYRYAELILPMNERLARPEVLRARQVHDHFGYPEYATLGEQYEDHLCITIVRMDEIVYQTVWKSVGRFGVADFERLDHDPTTLRVQANREATCFITG